jgi:hypothetical protein
MPDYKRSLTWRSLLLGTLAAVAICTLTPLNDLIFSDTSLSAGFMPLGAVLVLFVLVVAINGPLHRWFPRHALASGELAVILLMTLVACSLPNWGLIRLLLPMPIAPFHVGARDSTFWTAFLAMHLPTWLYPVQEMATGKSSTVATWFYNRVPEGESIPYSAWIKPLIGWGVFIVGMLATLGAIARIVLDQWVTNERLPFPLVQVQASLLEDPEPGFCFNQLFRSPMLWWGLGTVIAIDLLVCLNTYSPKHFPTFPLRYDFTGIFSEEPLSFLRLRLKKSGISFIVLGVTFFMRSRAAFSLWATFIILNLIDVQQGMRQSEMPLGAWQDQHLGACIAFVAGILWIGRRHWIGVIKGAFGFGSGRSLAFSFWVAIGGVAIMMSWLCFVGVQPWMAGVIVLFIIASHLIVARVVAETGLPLYRTGLATSQLYTSLPITWFKARDIYFASVFNILGPYGTRESLTTFATTGLAICKRLGAPAKRLGWAMVIALSLGLVAATFTTLYCQYSYPTPASAEVSPARNYIGAELFPSRDMASWVDLFSRGRFSPKQYSTPEHITIGFGVTLLLEVASLRYASWPFLPVGYVASYGSNVENAWFSIFVGWLCQVLIVRFGGASLFQKAKPFFIGLIFGEGLAAGIWLIINAIVVAHGGAPQSVKFLL